jgi:polyhydroxyalkanoate synthesis regulator phasin
LQNLKIIDLDVFNQVQSILDQRAEKDTEKRQIALRTQGEAMLSGNIFCAHCGGRLNVIRYKDHYTRKDGSEYSVNQIKYACYHKSRKLCDCEGQTTYLAERVDEIVSQVIRQLFATMKCAPQQERLEATLKHQIASNRAQQKKINHELEKRRSRLGKLQEEIANALSGESIYSPEDVAQAISKIKEGISALEQQLYDLENDAFKQRRTMQMITPSYNQFKSWAEEFDQASMEQKKMIACQLFKKIEVGRGYNVTFELNMTYQQFCSEWDGLATIFEQQDLIAQ